MRRVPLYRPSRSGSVALCGIGVLSGAGFLTLASAPLPAAPTGGQVTAGNGQITQSGNQTTITQQSQNLSIDWQSFNIGADQGVTFTQPGAAAIVLNQVLGQGPSQILGSLKANGQVFILNPNGVLFGRGAQVSVGGLVAGTLSLDVSDFLAGKYDFFGNSSADVTNAGTITAARGGYVALLGAHVSNNGRLVAPEGNVSMAAGRQVTLQLANGSLLGLTVNQGAIDALAANHGFIRANGGQVLLTAEAADALTKAVVNNDGVIEAQTLANHNGTISLLGDMTNGTVSVTGTLDASAVEGAKGGEIDVFGSQVTLSGNAQVNASGPAGGGIIHIGGDFHGATASENATRTYVGTDVSIHADATENGSGGDVSVWSDQQTYMYGNISAQGGSQGGNGGFVEASGKNYLDYRGNVNLLAPHGATGTLLLDPYTITIDDGSGSPAISPTGTNPVTFTSGVDSEVASSTINTQLGTSNVLIQTGTSPGGFITVAPSATLSWLSSNTLSLSASSDIAINSAISGINGALELVSSGGNISQTAAINVGSLAAVATGGTVTLTNTGNTAGLLAGKAGGGAFQYSSGGSITVGSLASVVNPAVPTTGIQSSNAVTLTTNGGSVNTSGATISGTTLSVTAQTGVGSLTTPLTTSVGTLTVANAGGDIAISNTAKPLVLGNITQTASAGGGIFVKSDSSITVQAGTAVSDPNTALGSDVALVAASGIAVNATISGKDNVALSTSGGNISQAATGAAGISAASLSANASAGSVTLNNPNNAVGTLAGHASSSFQFLDSVATTVGAVPTIGANTIAPAAQTGISTGTGGVTVLAAAGDLTLADPITSGLGILLAAEAGNFDNSYGSTALVPASGHRWLIYSQNPADDTTGGLVENFQQYDAPYSTTAAAATANGFLYSLAPLLTVSLTGTVEKTYDGTTSAPVTASNYAITGVLNMDDIHLGSTATSTYDTRNVGSGETVTVNGLSVSPATNGNVTIYGYQLSSTTASANIGIIHQATLNVNPVTTTKTYDSTTTVTGATATAVGLQTGDSFTSAGETFASANVLGTNGSTLTVNPGFTVNDGNGGNNYQVVVNSAAGTITPATLNLTAATDSKVYDATTTATGTTVGVSGLFGTDTISGTSESFASKNALGANGSTLVVNSGYVVSDGNSGNNYHVVTHTAHGTITPAPLTFTTVSDAKTYDGTTAAPGATVGVSGLLGTDSVTSLNESFNSKNVAGTNGSTLGVAGGYVISDGNSGHNYTVSSNTSSGTITPAALTLDAVTDTKTYDATTGAPGTTVNVIGLKGGDTVTGLTESFGSKNVLGTNGSTLSVNGGYVVNDGNSGTNYTLTVNTATGTINPATLTLNAVTDTKTYDATTAAPGTTVGISGLLGTDTITGVTESFNSKNVLGANGSTLGVNSGYTISDGNGGNNYTIVANTAAGTINPAALTLGAVTDSKTYDGTTNAGGTPVTVTGLKGSDTVTNLTESFNSKNAFGTNGSILAVDGGYVINDGNSGNNYSVTTDTVAGTINPAVLTITANDLTKPYGSANPAFTANYTGLGAGDTATSLSGTLAFSTTANTLSPLGIYPIVPSGLSSSNYIIDFVDGVLTIAQSRATLATSPGGPYDSAVAIADGLLTGSTPPQGQPAGPWLTIRGSGIALPPGLREAE